MDSEQALWLARIGRPQPPAEPLTLHAGPVTCELDGIDLRYVRLGGHEIVRRLHPTVRDRDWGTINGVPKRIDIERSDDSFAVRLEVRHVSDEIELEWTGELNGTAEGELTANFEARAVRDIVYSRIGLCVLHPVTESRGRPYRARCSDGWIEGTLPDNISPQGFEDGLWVPAIPPFDQLIVDVGERTIEFTFQGDLWETEDHRNWTDASLKTYCTPLSLGGPHRLSAGESIAQSVRVRIASAPRKARRIPAAEAVHLRLGEPTGTRVPAIGTALTGELPGDALRRVEGLRLAHLRIALDPAQDRWLERLGRAADSSSGLELALFIGPGDGPAVEELSTVLPGRRVARLLVLSRDAEIGTPYETTPPELVELVRRTWSGAMPALYAGTDHNFCELNRTRPEVSGLDGVCYAMAGEVHADDDRSLVEEFPAQYDTVRSAMEIAPGARVTVSPVTFKPRGHAGTARDPGAEDEDADPRQPALFAAAWTVGSLSALSAAGASSATYFEAYGPRGMFGSDRALRSEAAGGPLAPYPVYFVVKDGAELSGGNVIECTVDRPLEAAALAVRTDAGVTLLLANLTPRRLTISIPGLGAARVRRLNERTLTGAIRDPQAFASDREAISEHSRAVLEPFETQRVDMEE